MNTLINWHWWFKDLKRTMEQRIQMAKLIRKEDDDARKKPRTATSHGSRPRRR